MPAVSAHFSSHASRLARAAPALRRVHGQQRQVSRVLAVVHDCESNHVVLTDE